MEYYVGAVADLVSNNITSTNSPLYPDAKGKKKSIKRKEIFQTAGKKVVADPMTAPNTNSFDIKHSISEIIPKISSAKKRKQRKNNEIKRQQQADEIKSYGEHTSGDEDVASEKTDKCSKQLTERENRTIFVGNLPITVKKLKLKKYFLKYGEIEAVRLRSAPLADTREPRRTAIIKKHFHPDRSNIHAYIRYAAVEDAIKALEANGFLFDGTHHLRVDIANNKTSHDPRRAIFVGNVPFGAEEEELRRIFDVCGEIIDVRIIRDSVTGIGKGFAYINFKLEDSTELALKLDGHKLENRELRIRRVDTKVKKVNLNADINKKPLTSGGGVRGKGDKKIFDVMESKSLSYIPKHNEAKIKIKKKRRAKDNKKKEGLKNLLLNNNKSKKLQRVISF